MIEKAALTREDLHNAVMEFGSISEIANHYNVSYNTIVRKLKKYNIDYSGRKYSCDHDFFEENNEKSFYWAGFIAANGNISSSKEGKFSYRVSINASPALMDHLLLLSRHLKYNRNINISHNKNTKYPYDYIRFMLSSKKLVTDLINKFNITPRKTFIYFIPKNLLNNENIKHFYRGWVDGKGAFAIDHNTDTIAYFKTSGSLIFLNQFMDQLEIIGVNRKNIIINSSDKDGNKVGYITFTNKEEINKIADYLYSGSTVYLDRKKNEAMRMLLKESENK